MSSFEEFSKSSEHQTVPLTHSDNVFTHQPPEAMGQIFGKVGIVWAGLFAGITLGDVVLFATLVYTLLQIVLTVYERIIKPIREARIRAADSQES
jgi:Phage holin T7 family, holin superfamily II